MKTQFKITLAVFLSVVLFSFYNLPACADDNTEDLKQQIEALQKRVEELESSQPDERHDPWSFFDRSANRRWDPFAEMNRMQEQMDQMFQNSFNQPGSFGSGIFSSNLSFKSDLELKETDEGYEVVFDMAGLNKDKVDVQINEHSITVKGEHSSGEEKETQNSVFRSQSFGTFMKTIPLPVDADTTKVKTEKEGDRLVIRLPKKSN